MKYFTPHLEACDIDHYPDCYGIPDFNPLSKIKFIMNQ